MEKKGREKGRNKMGAKERHKGEKREREKWKGCNGRKRR